MPSDWLDRIKQTIAVDIGRFQTAGLPPKAIVEKLMEIPEFAHALQMRADRRKSSLWLPIESAPKDGTMILLAIEPVDEGYLLGWNPERLITQIIGWWGYSEWTSHLMEEGTADTEGHSSAYQIKIKPTHWQPLPDPPTS
jgi:hypothetical protein